MAPIVLPGREGLVLASPYAYEALQPSMSAEKLHYHQHHQAYVDALNKLLPGSGSRA